MGGCFLTSEVPLYGWVFSYERGTPVWVWRGHTRGSGHLGWAISCSNIDGELRV